MRFLLCSIILILISGTAIHAQTEEFIYEPIFGDTVFVRSFGNPKQQAVLLIHGVGSEASQVWDQTIPALQEQFYVLAVDLPGFGKSAKSNELYTVQRYTAFLRWLIDEFQIGPTNLVGHSLGAGISLAFAGTYPSAVKRLVLVDLYGVLHRELLIQYFARQRESKQSTLLRGPIHLFNELLTSALQVFSDKSINENIEKTLNDPMARRTTLRGSAQQIAGLSLMAYDFSWALDRVKTPTCIVWGAEDEIAPQRTAEVLRHQIAQAELHIIAGAGHSPMSEKPKIFNRTLKQFLTAQNYHTEKSIFTESAENSSQRVVHNIWKFDQVYSGDYDSLFIVRSKRVLLKDVQANYVEVRASGVTIEDSRIEGDHTGLYISASTVKIENSSIGAARKAIQARGADVEMTGVTLSADTALAISRSKFDIAGCYFFANQWSIARDEANSARLPVPDRSDFIFSVTKIKSGEKIKWLHGPLEISADNPQ